MQPNEIGKCSPTNWANAAKYNRETQNQMKPGSAANLHREMQPKKIGKCSQTQLKNAANLNREMLPNNWELQPNKTGICCQIKPGNAAKPG
jgi:hypothetical protein